MTTNRMTEADYALENGTSTRLKTLGWLTLICGIIIFPQQIAGFVRNPKVSFSWFTSSAPTQRVNNSQIAGGPVDASKLFSTADPMTSLGVRGICAAEGNCTANGTRTALSKGHVDPGNGVWNRGWCSDQGRGRNEAEADIKCLEYAQKWIPENQDAKQHGNEVFINAVDLANQSSVKTGLGARYARAVADGRTGVDAITHARVESFRRNGELSAGGLFKVCANPRNLFAQRLRGMTPYSDQWRYGCIRQDQERRVKAINDVMNNWSK